MYSNHNAGGANAGGGQGGFYSNTNSGGFQNSNANQFQNSTQQHSQQQHQFGQQPNVNKWAPPQHNQQPMNHSYNQQYSQQQQTQALPGASFFAAPQAAGTGFDMKGMATQAAASVISGRGITEDDMKKVWESGFARIIPGFDSTMQTLRTYYAVDNNYVKRKMQKVLFPFRSRNWTRTYSRDQQQQIVYTLPYSDENAPDLYIPVMSLVTYSLLAALCYGTAGKFNPEVIADVTSKCFLTQILEVAVIRFGFYAMQVNVAILDLICYTGYKYLGLTINMLFGLGFSYLDYGTSGFWVTFFWTASSIFFFMLKTMTYSIPEETASTGPKRSFMVLGFAISQVVTMLFVSQTKFL